MHTIDITDLYLTLSRHVSFSSSTYIILIVYERWFLELHLIFRVILLYYIYTSLMFLQNDRWLIDHSIINNHLFERQERFYWKEIKYTYNNYCSNKVVVIDAISSLNIKATCSVRSLNELYRFMGFRQSFLFWCPLFLSYIHTFESQHLAIGLYAICVLI